MTHDLNHAPVCGYWCGDCHFLGQPCAGCGYVEGKPFWAADMPGGICPLHECCGNQKGLAHCGLCGELPCAIFLRLRDPGMSEEAFQASLAKRQENLRRRTEIGTEAWLEEQGAAAG